MMQIVLTLAGTHIPGCSELGVLHVKLPRDNVTYTPHMLLN